jgi:hypothetical protein
MQIKSALLRRLCPVYFLLFTFTATTAFAVGSKEGFQHNFFHSPSIPETSRQHPTQDIPLDVSHTTSDALKNLHAALEVMQKEYFSLWLGKWTTAIDWTAAVTSTHLSATLSSFTYSLSYIMPSTFDKKRSFDVEAEIMETDINKYFAQTVTYYFGEDAFAIRNEAYDDMLWVVLGWLESIQFINTHSKNHYPLNMDHLHEKHEWYAQQFIPAFAHRARVFYELAEQGWDWRLCGGGMTWNPRLLPYKNAITNELFISASIGMYLHFPGDSNCSPFMSAETAHPIKKKLKAEQSDDAQTCVDNAASIYDPIYLANAINGYDWLANSNMTNQQGLYVDGFHIKDYATNHSKTECNERNEMVYTYNQGVVLSGLRGLWEATGNKTYLEDGHTLVQNVIRATGWTKFTATFFPPDIHTSPKEHDEGAPSMDNWAGLGAHGLLTEYCDSSGTCSQDGQTFKGTCSQDGQTFKGIFFHHLTSFCTPLPTTPVRQGKTHAASKKLANMHRRNCTHYTPWIIRNAHAALRTRDAKGRFGAWWGAPPSHTSPSQTQTPSPHILGHSSRNAIDYRNRPSLLSHSSFGLVVQPNPAVDVEMRPQREYTEAKDDLNDRGRGRTLETQAGGLAVVRAMWEFLRMDEVKD